MAALTDLSDLINRQTGGNNGTPEFFFINKPGRVAGAAAATPAAGRNISLWTYDGTHGAGAYGTGELVPTNSTNGAIPFTSPGGSREKWLIGVNAMCNAAGVFVLYDMLYQRAGLSCTSAADQTVMGTTPANPITRNTGGVGNFIAYELENGNTGTQTTITATYTDDAGNNGAVTPTTLIGGTGFNLAQRIQIMPLAAGDKGVRAIEKVKLTAALGSGTFSVVIGRPLVYLPVSVAGVSVVRDFTTGFPSIPKIDNNASLAWFFIPTATTIPDFTATLSMVEK
jgi:hypothetical protein